MAFVDVTSVNALLTATPNYIQKEPFYVKSFFKNTLYESFNPKGLYDMSLGKTATVITSHGEYPTQQPVGTATSAMGSSTGTGASNYCSTTPTVLKGGQTTRTYALRSQAFVSEVLCLNDVEWGFNSKAQISNRVKILTDAASYWWKLWYQTKNIEMVNKKFSTKADGATPYVENSEYDFSDILASQAPTTNITWDHLRWIYDLIARDAGDDAVAYSGGAPAFVMDVGPGIKRALWQTDADVRDTVDWGDSFQNFKAHGIDTSLYGFVPNVDVDIPRYDGVGRWIPPMINQDATIGRKGVRNPAYYSVAKGGSAVYEAITIRGKNIYSVDVRPTLGGGFDMASFNPKNYSGQLQWINNKDMVDNPLGDKGYFHFQIDVAAKPIYPENGIAILTLARD